MIYGGCLPRKGGEAHGCVYDPARDAFLADSMFASAYSAQTDFHQVAKKKPPVSLAGLGGFSWQKSLEPTAEGCLLVLFYPKTEEKARLIFGHLRAF